MAAKFYDLAKLLQGRQFSKQIGGFFLEVSGRIQEFHTLHHCQNQNKCVLLRPVSDENRFGFIDSAKNQ
jgi:hypothetical protein